QTYMKTASSFPCREETDNPSLLLQNKKRNTNHEDLPDHIWCPPRPGLGPECRREQPLCHIRVCAVVPLRWQRPPALSPPFQRGELSPRNLEHLARETDSRSNVQTVKIAKTKTLDKPLFFGYSFSSNPDYAYYELSTEWGNPFAANPNSLSPGDGCEVFDCAANDAACYSTPAHKKVYGCPQPVTLTADLCQ
ncbi:hypothetical protein N7485_009476, partial [Penicillium canescens]